MTDLFDRAAKAVSTTTFRLSLASAVVFVLAGALLAAFLFWQTNRVLTEQAVSALTAQARLLQGDGERRGIGELTETIRTLSRPDGVALYLLADANGQKVAGNLNRVPPEIATDMAGGVFYYEPQDRPGATRMAVAIRTPVGAGHELLVGRDIEEQRAFAGSMRWTFMLGFGVLSLLALIAGLAVSRLVLNRMDVIMATSRSIMEGNLSQRIPLEGSGGEIDTLAQNLNDMLERIENLMSGLREVSDNIAHDLKTPLTRLRNSAEAALRDPRGSEAYRDGLERTIEKADDLIKTFNALLLVARLEAGPIEENLDQFELNRVIEDVVELYTPAAEDAGFVLSLESEKGIWIRGNKHLLGQAVTNLIDNAIKYGRGGQPGAAITVRVVSPPGGGVAISVGDRGPGIPVADRARVLKRFVRLEASRTKPGTGLGFSLVAAVARMHHGELRLEDNEPGLKVTLVMPERVIVDRARAQSNAGQYDDVRRT